MKTTLWSILTLLCLSRTPLAATRNQTPSASIGTNNVSLIAWCNKEAGTIEAATFSASTNNWSSATTLSSGNGQAFHPLVAVDNISGYAAIVWIETDPNTNKYAVFGTFYDTSIFQGASKLSADDRDVCPNDLTITINPFHQSGLDVDVIVTWSEHDSGSQVISAVTGVVKPSSSFQIPHWKSAQQGP